MKETKETGIVRPGASALDAKKISSMSPEMMRLDAIKYLMGPPDSATLTRISKEQIILESVLEGAATLGYQIPATRYMIRQARGLSPGLDGLGRGEAVKCLVAHSQAGSMWPASAFPTDDRPGIISRLINFVRGGSPPGGNAHG